MPKTDQDVTIYQNSDEYITIAVTDVNGDPMDLNPFGNDLCWILSKAGSEVVRYDVTDTELGIVDIDGVESGLRVNLTDSVTADLECGRLYIHQAWGTLSGRSRPICIGYVTVERGDGC